MKSKPKTHKKSIQSKSRTQRNFKVETRTQRKLEIRIKPKSRTPRKLGFDNFKRKSKLTTKNKTQNMNITKFKDRQKKLDFRFKL